MRNPPVTLLPYSFLTDFGVDALAIFNEPLTKGESLSAQQVRHGSKSVDFAEGGGLSTAI